MDSPIIQFKIIPHLEKIQLNSSDLSKIFKEKNAETYYIWYWIELNEWIKK